MGIHKKWLHIVVLRRGLLRLGQSDELVRGTREIGMTEPRNSFCHDCEKEMRVHTEVVELPNDAYEVDPKGQIWVVYRSSLLCALCYCIRTVDHSFENEYFGSDD